MTSPALSLPKSLSTVSVLLGAFSLMLPVQANNKMQFKCSSSYDYVSSRNVPTTLVVSAQQERPIIRWVKAMGHITPQQRCNEVTPRLQTAYNNGSLNLITLGRVNEQPVICSAHQTNNSIQCDTVLMTLRHQDDAEQILHDFASMLGGRSISPIRHLRPSSSSQTYQPAYTIDLSSFQ